MSYYYQQNNRYFAQVAGGMETLATDELAELGAKDVSERYRGLYFSADFATLCRVNYCSRLISRVIAPLAEFRCRHTDQLYKKARSLNWGDFLSPEDTFAVYGNVSNSPIRHSHFATLRVKDGIADYFMREVGRRPNVDTDNPTVWVNLYIDQEQASIGVETSNGPLHKRGYRRQSVSAPMQETLAAAIIRLSEWRGERPLVDPMCGSGTLLCEALMHITNTPAGYLRQRFGFENLPEFDADVWKSIKNAADAAIKPLPAGLIIGSDQSQTALDAAMANLSNLPHGDSVRLSRCNYLKIKELSSKTIVTNPPYGKRMGRADAMDAFYKNLGDFLKQRCTGSTAYIYFGEREHLKSLGLRTTWKKPLANGALDGRLVKVELY